MVLKLRRKPYNYTCQFESSVNSDGTQTAQNYKHPYKSFESSVNSDGTQTRLLQSCRKMWFESSVNSDGTQTLPGSLG